MKKAKVCKPEPGLASDAPSLKGSSDKTMKPLNEKELKRLQLCIGKLEEKMVAASATYVEASSNENEAHVPAALVRRLASNLESAKELIETGKKRVAQKEAATSDMKDFWAKVKDVTEAFKSLESTVNACFEAKVA